MRARPWLLSLSVLVTVAATTWFCLRLDCYSTEELAPLSKPANGERTLVFVGDVMNWDRAASLVEGEGPLYPYRATLPLISGASLAIANLEGPVVDQASKVRSGWSYRVPPWTLRGLSGAGFDWVSLANNHLMDCGEAGLLETIAHLERAGIGHFGAGARQADAEQLAQIRVGDLNLVLVGLVAADSLIHDSDSAGEPGAFEQALADSRERLQASSERAGTIVATPESAHRIVAAARRTADFLVVVIHWGIRYQRSPSRLQEQLASVLVEAGADLVIGQHAHFWQPIGRINQVPIVYGTGNFAFGSANWRADQALLVRAVLRGRTLHRLEAFPLAIQNLHPQVRYQPKVLKGRSARAVLEPLREKSAQLGAALSIGADRAVLEL